MENVTGIHEEKMDKLVLDIYSYSDKVKRILQEIEKIVEKTSSTYDTNSAKEFINTFNLNKQKFETITRIILSYSDDMMNLKANYRKRMEFLSEEFLKNHNMK